MHQQHLFYDYIYLDKGIKEKDQEHNKKIKESILEEANRVKSYGDKLKSYRELLLLIKKWNYLTGPVKGDLEKKMNDKFDSIIQVIKENKMVTLGLDISTSCVGYAFTENKKILDMGFIDIKKFKNHKEKTFFVLTENLRRKHK